MGLSSEESQEELEVRYEELCLDLNMDKSTKDEAWTNYEKTKKNYSLEVNKPTLRSRTIFTVRKIAKIK